ncbi:unnamed protein product [Ambrosiozyma monospora]|uniref:Unnamed protein product n=1 Tax=Ambrosiozyma monospora TaxID=43982 RepID=A0ACB5SYH2_AMBMO|nr:unnamed protein product [Ambrosiozyma monospora]
MYKYWTYSTCAFDELHDCDPEVITEPEFLEKVMESRQNLVDALKSTPDWSEMRWINVNGIEKWTLFSIIDEYNLNPEAVSSMFNSGDDFIAEILW